MIDLTHVIMIEAHQQYGFKFFEAIETIENIGKPEAEKSVPKPEDEAANFALLMGQMNNTQFKGTK